MKGPLVQFQAARFSKDEMKRVVKMINGELGDAALASNVLDDVFEMWWPKLGEQVAKELKGAGTSDGKGRRSDRDLLEEVVALTRGLASDRELKNFEHPALVDLFATVTQLARVVGLRSKDDDTINAIGQALRPLRYFARIRGDETARHALKELEEALKIEPTYRGARNALVEELKNETPEPPLPPDFAK